MTDEPEIEDLIRYDVLTQNALRGVIRKVLNEVAIAGLPGEHHFFITFDTTAPGVRLSKRMRERYPETMTIVIQHTFWDLKVGETGFEVDLTFNDIRERLAVPFNAVQAFFDPSVKFGLQFDVGKELLDEDEASQNELEMIEGPDVLEDGALETQNDDDIEEAETAGSAVASIAGTKSKGQKKNADDVAADEEKPGEVVSLDAFRKKK